LPIALAEDKNRGQSSPPLQRASRRRAFFAWAILLAYAAFIDLTLATVPVWRERLIERFGPGVFAVITYGAAVILVSVVLGVMIFRNREKNIFAYLSLVAILLFLRHVVQYWITIPIEQIHFIEYGIMGFLAYSALKHHLRGWGLVGVAMLLTHFFGMIDECIQGNLASRVGEQRDMLWNGLAGSLGLAAVAFALKPKFIRGRSGRQELAAGLIIVGLCLPIQGYFNSAIAQFGRLIRDEEIQVVFRSRLAAEKLLRYNHKIEQFHREIAPRVGKAKGYEIIPLLHDKIHEEALVHMSRCRRHLLENDSFVALKEFQITSNYYGRFLQGTPLDLPAEEVARLTEAVGDSARVPYASPVAEHLITKFREWQMWLVIGLLEGAILGSLIKIFYRKERKEGEMDAKTG